MNEDQMMYGARLILFIGLSFLVIGLCRMVWKDMWK